MKNVLNTIALLLVFSFLNAPVLAWGKQAQRENKQQLISEFSLSVLPLLKTVSAFEKYKNRPQELFTSGPLAKHPFAQDAKNYLAQNNITNLPVLKREGYYLVFEQ